jgi:hypothetical protein
MPLKSYNKEYIEKIENVENIENIDYPVKFLVSTMLRKKNR